MVGKEHSNRVESEDVTVHDTLTNSGKLKKKFVNELDIKSYLEVLGKSNFGLAGVSKVRNSSFCTSKRQFLDRHEFQDGSKLKFGFCRCLKILHVTMLLFGSRGKVC